MKLKKTISEYLTSGERKRMGKKSKRLLKNKDTEHKITSKFFTT